MKRTAATRDWSDLHEDLLRLISKKIDSRIEDILAFRSVCVAWRSAAPKIDNFRFPLVLQTSGSSIVAASGDGKNYEIMRLPRRFKSWCLGSKGWILFLLRDGDMCLIHALTKKRIKLPSRKSLQKRPYDRINIRKAALSANPLTRPNDYMLAIIYNHGKLATWRPGDESYTHLQRSVHVVDDIMFHNGLLYASSFDHVRRFNVEANLPGTRGDRVMELPVSGHRTFLLELGEDIVCLTHVHTISWTIGFRFRAFIVDSELRGEIREIKDLGDVAIFVGANASFLLNNASGIPRCKPNHVYLTRYHKRYNNQHHIASYDFATRTVEYIHCNPREGQAGVCRCSHIPLWVQLYST